VKRLWVQQTVAFSLVVLVTMGAVVLWINRTTSTEFRKYVTVRDLAAPGSGVEALVAYYQERGSWEGVDGLLEKGVYISPGRKGLILAGTSAEIGPEQEERRADVLLADIDGRIVFDSSGKRTGRRLQEERRYVWPLTETDRGEAFGYLVVFFDYIAPLAPQEQRFLDRVERVLWAGIALAVGLIVVLATLLSRRLNAPLQRLVVAAKAVAAGDLEQKVRTEGSVEIAQVGQVFNEMTAALQEAEILRQNMVADVAHELRTPLSVLQGNLWAILNDAYPLEKAEIARLYDETRLLSRLVEDLRDLALADAGQLNLNLQPTDIGQIIHHAVDNFALVAEAQQVYLTAQLSDDAGLAHADADRVAQVLRNLLVNALRHTPSGGKVTVSVSVAEDMLEIAVADTGEGIAPEHIDHVFERFWRADPARARHECDAQLVGGTGLGLAVAKSLVGAQGGRIWVESTLGEGTVFSFTLPLV
jgi:two-component system OmpR family sensor kinase/two-component system sensor histidine kinase BaeS